MDSTLPVGLAHGTDPGHLSFVDRLCRRCPRGTNGLCFALGHSLIITLLVLGICSAIAGRAEFLRPSLMIAIGMVTLWKVRGSSPVQPTLGRSVIAQPFLLGMMLAVGSEAALQLPAFALAVQTEPLLLGAIFSGAGILADGGDGLLATSTRNREARSALNTQAASRALGYVVALPRGWIFLAQVIAFRIWARSRTRISAPLSSIIGVVNSNEGTL